jgi:diaminopimelate decarboxylase
LASGESDWWEDPGKRSGTNALTIKEYAAAVVPLLKKLDLRILFEPGRFLVGNAGVLLTKVLYEKRSPHKKFVIVDAGMNDLIRPALYEGYHEIVPLQEPASGETELADVVGPICESGDFFAQDREIPPVREGSLLALMSAGAYGFSMASNYNSRALPVEVMVRGRHAEVIRERQTLDDVLRGERIPDWKGA